MELDYEKEDSWKRADAPENGFLTLDMRFLACPETGGRTWNVHDTVTGYRLLLPSFRSCRQIAVHMAELAEKRKGHSDG